MYVHTSAMHIIGINAYHHSIKFFGEERIFKYFSSLSEFYYFSLYFPLGFQFFVAKVQSCNVASVSLYNFICMKAVENICIEI